MNDILYYESLYIYLRLDLNKFTGLEKHFQMTVFLSKNEKTQKQQQKLSVNFKCEVLFISN